MFNWELSRFWFSVSVCVFKLLCKKYGALSTATSLMQGGYKNEGMHTYMVYLACV